MSLSVLDRENMSAIRKLKCACPCGYGFETQRSEDSAIAMVQTHYIKFHADMLPFGITTAEARTLLTSIDDTRKTRITKHPHYPTDTTTIRPENTIQQEKTKPKKSHILVH